MYEELAKRLRDMSIPCEGWTDLYAEAADAIEELNRQLAIWKERAIEEFNG